MNGVGKRREITKLISITRKKHLFFGVHLQERAFEKLQIHFFCPKIQTSCQSH
jgi:hypothetical protein